MTSPYFSIIIPTYNRAALVQRALASVWEQAFTDYEVIVVDDGSTDDTLDCLSKFEGRLTVLKQENRGPGAARNLGIQHAQGERIAFLDSDDVWFPWTLAVHYEACMKGGAPAVTTGIKFLVGADEPLPQIERSDFQMECHGCFFDAWDGVMIPIGGTSSLTILRAALDKVGVFCDQPINGEDTDLWLRLGSTSGFIKVLQPVSVQTIQDSSITENCDRAMAGMSYLFEQQRKGCYTGTTSHSKKVIEILAASARSTSFHALRYGRRKAALQIYCRSFSWNLKLRRFKYIVLFPLLITVKNPQQTVQA